MAIIMISLNVTSFIEQNASALCSGILSGVIVGVLSWLFRIYKNTQPSISISDGISHSDEDNNYRIKIINNRLSNVIIVSANFIISYRPKDQRSNYKNDLVICGKADPLIYGRYYSYKYEKSHPSSKVRIRPYDTFVIEAMRITEESIKNKTSKEIKELYDNQKLTIWDFFKEDESTLITAVFEARNYRTGVTRLFYQTYTIHHIEEGKFQEGRSLKIIPPPGESLKAADNNY